VKSINFKVEKEKTIFKNVANLIAENEFFDTFRYKKNKE
jgi:hypothetical protein